MKKAALAIASVMLAGTLFAFVGCDGNGASTGKVSGNYKEATAEDTAKAIQNVDMETTFGDTTAEDFKLGFEAKANLDFNVEFSMKVDSQELMGLKANGGAKANYQLALAKDSLAGKGDASVNATVNINTGEKKTSGKSEIKANVYNDGSYIYLDGALKVTEDGKKSDQTVKEKYSLEGIIGEIVGGIGGGAYSALVEDSATEGEITGGMETDFNLQTAIDALVEAGFTVSLDQSSGLKIKVAAGKELVLGLLEDVGGEVSVPVPMDKVEFKACEIAVYLAFDKDYKFTQAGVNVNIDATLNVSDSTTKSEMKGKISMKGGVELKLFKGTVTLPEGIAADTSYTEKSL